jgi:hypothetical protein
MVVQDQTKKEEELKEKIFASEEKKSYFSEKFQKIEEKVKASLKNQSTDEALNGITI